MIYYLHELSESFFGPLRLFEFISFRAMLAGGLALVVGFAVAPFALERLRQLKMTQALRDASQIGTLAELHKDKKNTPTMGGLIVFAAVLVAALVCARPNPYVLAVLFVYTGLTWVGFRDDWLKVTRRNSRGLPGRWKMVYQAAIALIGLGLLAIHPESREEVLELWVPFYKNVLLDPMPLWFAFGLFFLVLAGSSNALNLTDGVDGLAIGCTITVAFAFGLMAYFAGHSIIADWLLISYIPGAGELTVVCAALLGASVVFLWYNSHPAEVFMGDTGSLALGGMVGAIAFLVHQPFTLIIVGGIFVMEAFSVILQVASFKLRGKRIFRMSPIHHHFQLAGWHENKIVIRFWALSMIFAIAGLATLKLR